MASASSERELLKRFEVQKFLGKGSYGSVCVGRRDARTGARAMPAFFRLARGNQTSVRRVRFSERHRRFLARPSPPPR
jgi:hypothetical protein